MKKTKTQRGITLIALIITIIVLLILAVVTINSLEEGGIVTHAENAASSYKQAQIDEEMSLFEMETYMNTQKKFSEATKERMKELCKVTGVTPKQLTVHYNPGDNSEYVLYRIDKTTEAERQALEDEGAKALRGDVDLDGVLTQKDLDILQELCDQGTVNGEEVDSEDLIMQIGNLDGEGEGYIDGFDVSFLEEILSGAYTYDGGYVV